MPHFSIGDVNFHYVDKGEGEPWVFLHGMGSDLNQPAMVFNKIPNVRFISMDFRGHGETPFTDVKDFTMNQFANDVVALMDHLKLQNVHLGGISLGAAVTLNLVSRFPKRFKELLFIRPAWLDKVNPVNLELSKVIGELFETLEEDKVETAFRVSEIYDKLEDHAPGCLQSITGQLGKPHASTGFKAFTQLIKDSPISSLDEIRAIDHKTLVLGNLADPVHPITMAKKLAELLPNAKFGELPERYTFPEKHYQEAHRMAESFIE